MKKIILTLFLSGLTIIVNAQNIVPLTDNLSFITNTKNVHVVQTKDTMHYNAKGEKINIKKYDLKGDENSFEINRMTINKEGNYEFVSVKNQEKLTAENGNRSTDDTLFFVLDTVYGWGVFQDIILARKDTSGIYMPLWINDTLAYFTWIQDTFDIISMLPKDLNIYTIFTYDYVFDHTDTLYLSSSLAPHHIHLDPVDENGVSINNFQGHPYSQMNIRIFKPDGGQFFIGWDVLSNSQYFVSDYHEGMEKLYFTSKLECPYFNDFPSYIIEYPLLDSIVDSVYFTNPPDSLVNVVTNFTYHHHRDYDNIGFGSMIKYLMSDGSVGYGGIIVYYQDYKFDTWEGSMHMYQQNRNDIRFYYQNYMEYTFNGEKHHYIASSEYEHYNDSITATIPITPDRDAHYHANYDTLFFGKGLIYYWNIWKNTYGVIHVTADKMGMWGDWIYPMDNEDKYFLKDQNNNVIASGSGLDISVGGLTQQIYTLIQQNSYTHFNGYSGTATVTSHLNLKYTDHTPPAVSNIFFVNEANKMKYQFADGESIFLQFTAADFVTYTRNHVGISYQDFPDSLTTVRIKKKDDTEWQDVDIQKVYADSSIGYIYRSDLTDYIEDDSALYDIKIYVEDDNGNNAEYVFRPAFIYGAFTLGTGNEHINPPAVQKIIFASNPVSEKLKPLNKGITGADYIIYSSSGNAVQKGILKDQTVNVSSLSSGVYTIVLFKENKNIAGGKFIKIP